MSEQFISAQGQNSNNLHFAILGDFNKVSVSDILDSYGALQNIQIESTRKNEILDLILTDLHTSYLPSKTIAPLEVDANKKGVPSDHKIVIFPRSKMTS